MRAPNPRVQTKIFENRIKKQQELTQAHRHGIILGAKRAAKAAREMLESGWTDMATFEAEVWKRVRTGKK